MILKEVLDKREASDFLNVPKILYRNDPEWVCVPDTDIEAVFDPLKNVCFLNGEATRWVLYGEKGELLGRIAAFIDRKTYKQWDQPTGGIGFFESVNSRDAAFMLFDRSREWLRERGMEAMDGPINFGETDRYWGLLTKGFTRPAYEVPYNPPWYRELFEAYGFKIFYEMTGYLLSLEHKMPERFLKIAEWITRKPDYHFRHYSRDWKDKFTRDFTEVYNSAWEWFKKDNFEPILPEYIKRTLKKGRFVIDDELLWIAYYKDRPVSIFIMYPDVNDILRYFNGTLGPFNILKFMWMKKRKKIARVKALMMGVIPEFHGLGLESGYMHHVLKVLGRKPWYKEIEFSWIADFNPPMHKIFKAMGADPAKGYITFRYLFDQKSEFRRYPIPEE